MHDFYDYDTIFPKIKLASEREYVAWIGRFVFEKNLPRLLKIVKYLPNLHFKIAGEEGKYSDKSSKIALQELRESPNVTFVGYLTRKEVLPFLSNAYALLNTSYVEGFSRTFLEAFTVGTPIVTSKKVDPDAIIQKYHLGIVVEEREELGEALKKFIYSDNLDKMALRCREYVVGHHSPNMLVKKFIKGIGKLER